MLESSTLLYRYMLVYQLALYTKGKEDIREAQHSTLVGGNFYLQERKLTYEACFGRPPGEYISTSTCRILKV